MTPEEINRAIAEHCGWEDDTFPGYAINHKSGFIKPWREIPDCYNDLNAMREAEVSLLGHRAKNISATECRDIGTQRRWEVELYFVIRRDDGLSDTYLIEMYRAATTTAPQRAEAFLRTIGKWRDTTKEEA